MGKYDLVSKPNKIIELKELLPGDILMTHGERWLSEKIQYFMKVQAHKWYGVDMYEWFNHMATVIEPAKYSSKTIIAEAIASGYNLHPMSKKYANESINKMVVARPLNPFNSYEQGRIIEKAELWDSINIKYEFTNFLWWIPYIYSKGLIDWSPKGEKQDDRLFCFESAMLLWKEARRGWIDGDASKITTVSLQIDYSYEVRFFNLKY